LRAFIASLLIAGKKDVKFCPFLSRAPRARNVYPKNVNDVCSAETFRRPSLQYTIFVFSGCSVSPTPFSR
jgi:hypothetical protein